MNVVEIIFSPTGGTEKVAHIIGGHWSKNTVKIDLCDSKIDFTSCNIAKDDMVLIAMPSFGGRAPAVAIERLKQISGNGAKCTLVCVYGNRAYEDTLVEMEDAAKECGLVHGKTTLVLDGGELQIENSSTNGDVIMTGPAQTVFEGKIEI